MEMKGTCMNEGMGVRRSFEVMEEADIGAQLFVSC